MIETEITCQICGAKMREVTWRHLKLHNTTLAEYKVKFPGIAYRSSATHLLKSKSAVLANADLERRKKQSEAMSGSNNPFFGCNHTDEVKAQMSANLKAAWSKNYDRLLEVCRSWDRSGNSNPNWRGGEIKGGKKHKSRMQALALYGEKCMHPGCSWDLMVENHHITPRGEGGSYETSNCIILCPNHHAAADVGILTREYLYSLVAKYHA